MSRITETKNPFTRDFGTVTESYIMRTKQQDDISRSFIDEITDDKAYFIVGQRGFGKSSLLRAVKNEISKIDDWYVIELRSNNDNLIHELAASLYAIPTLKARFIEMDLDFSLLGIGLNIKKDASAVIVSDEIAVKKMLDVTKTMNKKILVAIDEVTNTPALRDFYALFNVCKGENYPIYLLLDGLYKNTNEIKNDKALTFLKRVQKLELGPLDRVEMFNAYKKLLHLENGNDNVYAERMAKISCGYPYAYQLIGYYTWLWLKDDDNLFEDFEAYEERLYIELDRNLNNYVYSTLWEEISPVEKNILSIMATYELTKVQDIRNKYNEIFTDMAEMTSSNFSKYRDKLIKFNLLKSSANTILEFVLPRFANYARINRDDRI